MVAVHMPHLSMAPLGTYHQSPCIYITAALHLRLPGSMPTQFHLYMQIVLQQHTRYRQACGIPMTYTPLL